MTNMGSGTSRRARVAAVGILSALALVASACGTRLTAAQQAQAQGSSSANGAGGSGASSALGASGSSTGSGAAGTGASSTGSAGAGSTSGAAGTGGARTGAAAAASTTTKTTVAAATKPVAGAASAGACGADGTQTPAGGNGGATATGVTANSITVGNIASLSGVAPGLTQSAQQATEAWAAYVNSTGGICGRQIKVSPYDDGNNSGTNYSDAQQACSSDFAMVGNASGFDDGESQAVAACSIPTLGAEISTAAAGATADIFGASPGNEHYWSLGPAVYLKATYPTAIQHAAMIYLNVSATQTQATHEVDAYKSVGFNYVYDQSTTATNSNYAANVQAMQSAGAQYVTEYSDASSAERLLQSMQQANWSPPVVDWFSEEYSPQFAQQTQPESNGDLVLMSATAAYEEASSNPGMQLMESWLNRVAPGYHQDIFAILAWSAGLAFEQAAKAVGPNLTRPALLAQIQQITNWTGGGITPPVNIGGKIPSKCFDYFKIVNGAFQRVYPTAPNTYDCNTGFYQY
ncbi:MAG TPA: ABC transporter substrate-binding protein [Acidimicrobiales bacterium]|nr:ABC transporter substrate-binding protein [Acidimicrobiales bacterium]